MQTSAGDSLPAKVATVQSSSLQKKATEPPKSTTETLTVRGPGPYIS